MNKGSQIVAFIVVFVGLAAYGYFHFQKKPAPLPADYKNTTYTIEELGVKLTNGESVVQVAPGSVTKVTTKLFDAVGKGDVNGDDIPDLIVIITRNQGGSGTFYYAAAALQNADGSYTGTNGVLLGDRIAPQTAEIKDDGMILVNYADRRQDEPMTAVPSVGVTKKLRVTDTALAEVWH